MGNPTLLRKQFSINFECNMPYCNVFAFKFFLLISYEIWFISLFYCFLVSLQFSSSLLLFLPSSIFGCEFILLNIVGLIQKPFFSSKVSEFLAQCLFNSFCYKSPEFYLSFSLISFTVNTSSLL